jgi:hypothetical protein
VRRHDHSHRKQAGKIGQKPFHQKSPPDLAAIPDFSRQRPPHPRVFNSTPATPKALPPRFALPTI